MERIQRRANATAAQSPADLLSRGQTSLTNLPAQFEMVATQAQQAFSAQLKRTSEIDPSQFRLTP